MIKPDGKISDILFETEVFHNKEQAKQREYFSQQEFQKKEQEKVQLENKLIQKQEKAQEQLKKIMQQKKEEIEKYQQNIVQKRINSAQKYVNLLRKLLTVFLEQYVQDIFLIQSFSNYLFQLNNVLQIEQAQAAEKKQLLQKQNEKKLNYHYQQSPRANKDLNSINDNVNNNVNNNNWFVPQVKPLEKVDKQIDNKQQQQVFFIPAPVKKKAQISAVKAKPKPIIEKAPVIKKAIDQKSQENERIEKDNQRKQEREKMIQDIQRRKLEKQQNEDIHIQWIGGGGVDDTTTTDNTEEEKQVQQMKFRRVRSSQSQEKHEEFKKILADKENLKKMQQAELQKKSLEKMKKIKDEIRQQNELQSMKEQIKMDEDEERINEIIQNIDQKNQEILDFMKNSNKELQIIDDCNFDQENIQQNTGKFEINQGEIKIESEDIDTNKCDESNNIDQQNIAKKRQLSESCEQKCNDESVLDQQLISSDEHQIISHAQMMLELQNLVENMNKEVGNMPENKYEKNLPDNVFDFTQMPPQKNEKLQFQIQDQRQDISDEDSDDLAQEFNKNYTAINQQTQFIIDTQEEDTMFYISDFSKIENLRLLLEENLGADKFISSYKILQEKFDQYSIEEIEKMYGHDNYASLLPQFQQVDLDKYLALLFTLILMEEKMQTFNC